MFVVDRENVEYVSQVGVVILDLNMKWLRSSGRSGSIRL